ncbi:TetR family transcriptional regulator [Actinotalea sp. M2MS4P-6]|uniref:TetR/AcrR family transcriptional regulator n=1 Tax=Actinotalea sp. M2MS4P-6 TaxID=2983762 RepID=UPI0021E3F524|nr:TetR family transcriptional regulator [Actinotalea sp. M2MS4P-6]MCV2395203.1 TetR family transcriptional regulator [Actinotalea sp. M2MS4P-6]
MQRAPLTRALLVERALAIVDRDGLDALTMRRLAADLGVKAASLYNHVSGRDDLLDGAVRLVRAEMRLPEAPPDDWREMLGAIYTEYLRVLARHPNLVPLAGRRTPGEEVSGLEYLTRVGFAPRDAVRLWQSLTALVTGFAMFRSGYAASDARGLPAGLADQAGAWREETCTEAVRLLMDAFELRRGGTAKENEVR